MPSRVKAVLPGDELVRLPQLLTHGGCAPQPVHWRAGWTALVLSALARAGLTVLFGLLLWTLAPMLTGWQPSVVLSGSMRPALHPGDVVITRAVAASQLRPGQIVLADDPDHPGRLRLHRLVSVTGNGQLQLRGDANAAADSSPVPAANVRGVGVLRVPLIGRPVYWARNHDYLRVAAAGITLLALGYLATRYRAGSSRRTEPDRPAAATPLLARSGAVLVLLGLAASQLLHPAPARAALTGKAGNPTDSWGALKYFSCKSAQLASSPSLYYRFEETAGPSAADSSGTGLTGTYSASGISYRTAGACSYDAGRSITLDGSSGCLYQGTQIGSPGTFSSEVWFKTTTTRGGWLIGMGSSTTGASTTNDHQLFMTDSGSISFGILTPAAGAKEILSPAGYNDGAWHLAVATFSAGSGMKLYLDGSLVASNATVTAAKSYNGYIRIGYDSLSGWPNAPTSSYFAGSLDEVAAYSGVLSAADASAHYAAGS